MVSVWCWDGLEIVGWFMDGLGMVEGWLGMVCGWFGAGLGLVWGWFWGQWDGEIRVTIQAGLLSHWPDYRTPQDPARQYQALTAIEAAALEIAAMDIEASHTAPTETYIRARLSPGIHRGSPRGSPRGFPKGFPQGIPQGIHQGIPRGLV
jgi:hypothetical protein